MAGDRTEKFAPEQHKRELQKLADRLGVCPAQADDARPRKAQEQEKRNFDVFRDILHEHGLAAAKRWWEAELLNEQLEVCGKTSDKSLHEDIRTAFGKAGKQSDELWKETQVMAVALPSVAASVAPSWPHHSGRTVWLPSLVLIPFACPLGHRIR